MFKNIGRGGQKNSRIRPCKANSPPTCEFQNNFVHSEMSYALLFFDISNGIVVIEQFGTIDIPGASTNVLMEGCRS